MSASPQSTLTQRIKARAQMLGFVAVGIAAPDAALTHGFYQEWIAAGHAGAMSYLERHAPLKTDPRQLMEQLRSLVLVAFPYGAGQVPEPHGLQGRVARYAWGRDYHEEMTERLARLAQGIEEEAGHPIGWRTFADTVPILEREWAVRAGLGWVGKNALLINWQHGSWLFLGGLLLDIRLDPDKLADTPSDSGMGKFAQLLAQDGCGACRACLDACPTQAIVADRTVDARRCIAYHTIELKGPIPEEFRNDIGSWVFGCDICQDVCPWNRSRSKVSTVPPHHDGDSSLPENGPWRAPNLVELIGQSEDAFREKFGSTAFQRTRRRGLARNAAIALGNALAMGAADGSPLGSAEQAETITALERGLADPEPVVRGAAAWGLARARASASRDLLALALETETDPGVRQELDRAISILRQSSANA